MNLHLNYNTVEPFALKRIEKKIEKDKQNVIRLKADKEKGKITLDDKTTLTGIPEEAWKYKLRTRSALEWILDQYKDKTPTEKILQEFHEYNFEDYKEEVVDLIKRLVTVSVETVRIANAMEKAEK